MTITDLRIMVSNAVSNLDKRTMKTIVNKYDSLTQEEKDDAKQVLNLSDDITIVDKELTLFYLKGKPTVKLPLSFTEFEQIVKMLKKLK